MGVEKKGVSIVNVRAKKGLKSIFPKCLEKVGSIYRVAYPSPSHNEYPPPPPPPPPPPLNPHPPTHTHFFTLTMHLVPCFCSACFTEPYIFINLGHISFQLCPLCQNCHTIMFFIFVVRCDVPCTWIMNRSILYNFDNRYIFIHYFHYALNSSLKTVRVVMAKRREVCLRSERPRISRLLEARQSIRHSVYGIFKCIPFDDSDAFWV